MYGTFLVLVQFGQKFCLGSACCIIQQLLPFLLPNCSELSLPFPWKSRTLYLLMHLFIRNIRFKKLCLLAFSFICSLQGWIALEWSAPPLFFPINSVIFSAWIWEWKNVQEYFYHVIAEMPVCFFPFVTMEKLFMLLLKANSSKHGLHSIALFKDLAPVFILFPSLSVFRLSWNILFNIKKKKKCCYFSCLKKENPLDFTSSIYYLQSLLPFQQN